MRQAFAWVLMAAACALAAGCTVGPDYVRPTTPLADRFTEAPATTIATGRPATPATAIDVDDASWWSGFGDPQLTALVGEALVGNPDIGIAASRVRQARLQEIAAGAVGKPTVDANGNVTNVQFSKNAGLASLASQFGGGGGQDMGGIALPGGGITTYSAGFDASWELDLFGGGRRGRQAATARVDAATWNVRDAALTLGAEIADQYFSLRVAQRQVALLDLQVADQARRIELADASAQVGLMPRIDVTRERAELSSLRSQRAPLDAEARVRAHAIGVLLGKPPEDSMAALLAAPTLSGAVPSIPPGLPSDLLRRRPDVRAAERNLAAATADIGVAVADLYPKFSLTGMVQLISSSLSTLLTRDSLQTNASAAIAFPLIDWGRRRAEVGMRREQREQAYLQYQKTVLGALRDVEDALARVEADHMQTAALDQRVRGAQAVERAAQSRSAVGLVALDTVLDARARRLSAESEQADSAASLRRDTASVYKALGGGWTMQARTTDAVRDYR